LKADFLVELNNDELKCLTTFEETTGAYATDCLLSENGIIFVIKSGDLGKAIGKKGANINRARTAFGRPVFIVEEAADIEQFIRNLFGTIPIRNINIHEKNDSKTAFVTVDDSDRGVAIGKNGDRVKLNRAILLRKFGCDLKLYSK